MNRNKPLNGMRSLAALAFIVCAALGAHAQRHTYTSPERTVNVDPPGVDCAATPGSCFKIHYVVTGFDAPSLTDADGNGRPDYIDMIVNTAAEVFDKEVTRMGWTAPPSDLRSRTNGGDGRLDVYVWDFGCTNIANVTWEGAVAPGSVSFYSYMNFDNDVKECYDSPGINSGPGDLSTLTRLQVVQDVFAHEYHHAIQAGMNVFSTGEFKEGAANWMNDEAYDELNANVHSSVLGGFQLFESPATSLNSISYGQWFWLRYLSERFGVAFVRDVWREMALIPAPAVPGMSSTSELPTYDTLLGRRRTTLRDAWVDFSGKLYAKQWFEEGSTYPDVRPRGIVNGRAPFNTYPVVGPPGLTINHMARKYYQFDPSSPASAERTLRLAFNGPDGQDSGAVVIYQTADGRRIDQRLTLDAANDGTAAVPGFSLAPPPALDSARVTSAVLAMSNATQAADVLPFSFCGPNCPLADGADPMITPWGADWGYREPLWQTIDMWVDNDGDCRPDAPGRPGCNEADDPLTPVVDAEPTKGRVNTLHARIRNLGNRPLAGVSVSFQYSPYGMGLPGPSFADIGTATTALAAAGDPAGGDVRVLSVAWDLSDLSFNHGGRWDVPGTPGTESIRDFDHFCGRARITSPSDTNPDNNFAQNNFSEIPLGGSMRTNFLVGNPHQAGSEAEMVISPALPEGWLAKSSGVPLNRTFKLKPGEIRMAFVEFSPPPSADPPTRDVVANISLKINGEYLDGVSILLARAKTKEQAGLGVTPPSEKTSGGRAAFAARRRRPRRPESRPSDPKAAHKERAGSILPFESARLLGSS